MSAVLRVRDLRVHLESRRSRFELAVDSLDLVSGEVLAVLGANGAGKTTLLRALAGLVPVDAGRIERTAAGPVTLVFQRPIAFSGTVAHNVRVALIGARLPRGERDARVAEALGRFGIATLAERSATRLSGGELRRLALARAFALRPSVLLLDEPFDDLDAAAQRSLGLDLRRAIEQTDAAVGVVTHDLRQAVSLADRIAVLAAGRLLQVGRTADVLAAPVDAVAARTVGMRNLVPGTLRGGAVVVDGDHRVHVHTGLPDGSAVWLGLRPEHVKLDVGRGTTAPIGKGVVRRIASDGVLTQVTLEWAGHELETHLLSGRGLARTLRAGDGVVLSVAADDAHVMPRDEG
ncbi:MAG: ABC transporter ATP-binding protein [Deltaproteobacteria bacterium]|nr:ABC transporter ATP-binding protein [Deltaproteobacteria bacterium]MBW2416030.1 ABC transporter ATP-binding protein [Deltaproteobacteria bacterium]